MSERPAPVLIRPTRAEDFDGIIALCQAVYPHSLPWGRDQLASHLAVFPEGQLVAVTSDTQAVVGMAASLIVTWDDYDPQAAWRDVTDHGTFRNHDPAGRTLYGAEIMVHPRMQRRRIGKRLYAARREIAVTHGLARIRAGARLRGYARVAARMTAEEYVLAILRGERRDPTLSFQLREGFAVFGVVADYLKGDPESLGYAALIEWLNPAVARPEDVARRDAKWSAPGSHRVRPGVPPG